MNRDTRIGCCIVAIVLGVVGALAWGGIHGVSRIQFGRHCLGYLKNAADSNTVETAVTRLSLAVDYIEKNRLTSGFTSIVWTAPNEDVEFWATNITSALTELKGVPASATPLEKSNVLMKLRETILDDSDGGQVVTCPAGLSVFPYNTSLCWLACLSVLLGVGGIISSPGEEKRHVSRR